MPIRDFNELIDKVKSSGRKTVALVCADDEHALQAVIAAQDIVDAALVGDPAAIEKELKALGHSAGEFRIVPVPEKMHPSIVAAQLIQKGEADFLMKGRIMTGTLLKGVLAPESGLRTGRLMSHLILLEIPGYPKLLGITDPGMCPNPDLEQKKQILLNAVEFFHKVGYEEPSVAALCAVETINPKMVETIDASELVRMNRAGEIPGCYVEGPISYDLAMYPDICRIKGYETERAGDFDILLMPQIVVGNVLGKCLTYTCGGSCAGIILGCKVPVVLTSRGASAMEKYYSLALAAGVC